MTFRIRFPAGVMRAGLALAFAGTGSSAVLADETKEENGPWQVTLGAGVMQLPEYPGSDEGRTQALPLVSVRYKRFFLGGAPGSGSPGGLGAYLYESDRWSLGAVIAPDGIDPREESDDERLRGLGDIDASVRAGLFTSYRITSWLRLGASALTDVGDKQQGTIANLDAEFTYRPFPKLLLSGGPGISWTDEEYMQTYFGITGEQAARSAFSPYTPAGGVSTVRLSFGAQYLLGSNWFLGARVTAAQLQGDAADSPIVVEKNQNLYALFFGYRF
jgi:MipA family protein